MVTTAQTHVNAKQDCEAMNAHIVTITDSTEENYVDSLR